MTIAERVTAIKAAESHLSHARRALLDAQNNLATHGTYLKGEIVTVPDNAGCHRGKQAKIEHRLGVISVMTDCEAPAVRYRAVILRKDGTPTKVRTEWMEYLKP